MTTALFKMIFGNDLPLQHAHPMTMLPLVSVVSGEVVSKKRSTKLDWDTGRMPIGPPDPDRFRHGEMYDEHKPFIQLMTSWFNACVAEPVPHGQLRSNPGAKAAMDAEWLRLRKQVCWDEENPVDLPVTMTTMTQW